MVRTTHSIERAAHKSHLVLRKSHLVLQLILVSACAQLAEERKKLTAKPAQLQNEVTEVVAECEQSSAKVAHYSLW